MMKRIGITLVSGSALCLLLSFQTQKGQTDQGLFSASDSIARGQYLVMIGGCNDCHSPKKMTSQGPVPDPDRLLSGYDASRPFKGYDANVIKAGKLVIFNTESTAFAGPWGVSYAANLTPHETGLKHWNFDQFKKAMRKGKSKGIETARPLLPPMPWQNYTDMAEEDMASIFAYLKSLKPIDNLIPAPIPPQPWTYVN